MRVRIFTVTYSPNDTVILRCRYFFLWFTYILHNPTIEVVPYKKGKSLLRVDGHDLEIIVNNADVYSTVMRIT